MPVLRVSAERTEFGICSSNQHVVVGVACTHGSRHSRSGLRCGCNISGARKSTGQNNCGYKKVCIPALFQPLESLLEAVSQTRPEMIVPCDDRAVTHLHQLHAAATEMGEAGIWIKNLIEKSIGPPESFAVASSRFRLWQVAKAENVLVPEMKLLASLTDLDSWRRDRPLPWILKADGSWAVTEYNLSIRRNRQRGPTAKCDGLYRH